MLIFIILLMIAVLAFGLQQMMDRRKKHIKKLENIQKKLDQIEARKAAEAKNPKKDRE